MKNVVGKSILVALFAAVLSLSFAASAPETAKGVVYHDKNENQIFDKGDKPLKNIRVSNGRDIVLTDKKGRYAISVDDDSNIFVIKPSGWRTPVDAMMIPRFYYTHKPKGSPKVRYVGVAPTGPLPASIDFPLYKNKEPDKFKAIFWADPQPRNLEEIEYITHDVIEDLVGTDATFGVTLGDIMFDDLSLFEEQARRVALIGIPWYNVIGNHDINYDVKIDKYSDETFERVFGPPYYSFDHGEVHFLVLDDVVWSHPPDQEKGKYHAGLEEKQIEFIKNDLALVPEKQLVVLMMHIPLDQIKDRQDLFRLIEQRPYCMSISGHTHYQDHRFITKEDGWMGPEPHHHTVNVTVSGSWWSGVPDELGIPHTTMRDGAPNGYSIITFDEEKYSIEYVAARRPRDHQMTIYLPETIAADELSKTRVIANIFAGSFKSTVEMKLDGGEWVTMKQTEMLDPYFVDLKKMEEEGGKKLPGRKLPQARKTKHIWTAPLPSSLISGIHEVTVRTTDMYGQTYTGERAFKVE